MRMANMLNSCFHIHPTFVLTTTTFYNVFERDDKQTYDGFIINVDWLEKMIFGEPFTLCMCVF